MLRGISLFVLALAMAGVSTRAQDVNLRAGDQLEIRLGGVPIEEATAVSGAYTIDGEGNVNMPHIGKVRASGLTQAKLQSAMEASYKSAGIYQNPTITVLIPTQARFVNVGGEVRVPQRVAFTPDLTCLGAITAAGGFTEYADEGKVRVLRGSQPPIIVNIKAVRKDPSKDIKLQPGDNIEVPQSFF